MQEMSMPGLGAGLAGGGIAGFSMGYALKKVANLLKILAITLVGLQLFVLSFLESKGIINVDWESLNSGLSSAASEGVAALVWAGDAVGPVASTVLSFLPATGGAVAGFAVGWKRG